MTKKQTIQIRVSENDKDKLEKYVSLLKQDDPSVNITSFVMDALEYYYSDFRIEEDTKGNKKLVQANKFVYKLDEGIDGDDAFNLSVEQKELSLFEPELYDEEEMKKSRIKKVNRLASDFLLTVALQKKAEERKEFHKEKESLLEKVKNF